MKKYEYQITSHPSEQFTKLVYFCGEGAGGCKRDEVPGEELSVLADLLNERGAEGWEAIQIKFGKDGAVVFWKREVR